MSPAFLYSQETRDGMFITVPNPIDDKAVSQIERKGPGSPGTPKTQHLHHRL